MKDWKIVANLYCSLVVVTIAHAASGVDAQSTDALLAQLKNPEPDTRIAAQRELQTSLDPRIPDAMLPLLSDEGNSIRRLAAAIGSRWWQIPKEKVPQFVEALRRNENSEFEDEKKMVTRGIGLLTHDYKSKMLARSSNGRWVVYERRGLPWLIDTTTDTEELLGGPRDESTTSEGMLLCALGNGLLGDAVAWHPTKEAVAFSVLMSRRSVMIWIWEHRFGLQKLQLPTLMKLLKLKEPVDEPNPFTAQIKGWKNNELHVSVDWGRDEQTAVVAWDLSTHKWRVVSRQAPAKG